MFCPNAPLTTIVKTTSLFIDKQFTFPAFTAE
jgi:hypothetical protein